MNSILDGEGNRQTMISFPRLPNDMIHYLLLLIILLIPSITAHTGVGDTESLGPVIGIDLGTTYSCVGIYREGRVEIIANSQGQRTTPSWVAFRGSERLVGDAAKHAFHSVPEQTIYSVKRVIGRNFDDPELQHDKPNWPFSVVDRGGRPSIQIQHHGQPREFTPEEIASMILVKMKETAEAYLGMKVSHAVVTVPAYFNDAQRQATKDAGAIAGLKILRILNEPTAAAIAYGLDRLPGLGQSKIMVYDLGGGTFDVSLLSLRQGVFKVLATSGNTHLGGEDFDIRLVRHFTELYKRRFGVDVTTNHRSMSKLKKEVERAKRALSTQTSVTLDIESFYMGRDFSEVLTRAKFEQLNLDLFRKTLEPVQQVLKDAKLNTKDIDEIVLVGGSTRIPRIRELLKEMFRGKEPSQGINPDEAVAIGAAISAGMLSGAGGLEDVRLADVCPFTIGIETAGGTFTPFIRRGTPIPATHTEIVSTVDDNQSTALIQIYEGEDLVAERNTLMGEFALSDIPFAARGIVQIEIKFELDADSILRVEAKERLTGNANSIVISSRRHGLNDEELEQLRLSSEQHSVESTTRRLRIEKVEHLDSTLNEVLSKLNEQQYITQLAGRGLNSTVVRTAVYEMLVWLDNHEVTATPEELDKKLATIKSLGGM